MLCALVVDPVDTAILSHNTATRAFQVELKREKNKGGPWPSEYIVTCVHSGVSDLCCYITMQSHCLQNVGAKARGCGVREPDHCHLG